jgi:hypothetical protein
MDELRALSSNAADAVPAGWLTRRQWEGAWGVSEAQAFRLLRGGIASGRMEAKVFRVPGGLRGVYPTPHYRERVSEGKRLGKPPPNGT